MPATSNPKAQVVAWLLDGHWPDDIAAAIASKFPDEDAAGLLNAAGDHFATVAEADPLVIRGWCLEAYRELYRKMVEIGDYAGALKAIRELMAFARSCSKRESRTTDQSAAREKPMPLGSGDSAPTTVT